MRGRDVVDWLAALLGAAAIASLAVSMGLATNHLSAQPLPLFASAESLRAPVPQGVTYISIEEARRRLTRPGAVLVDGRPAAAYEAGHLPGAWSVPVDAFTQAERLVRSHLAPAEQVICYCDTLNCDEGARLTAALTAAGYRRVALLFEGYEGWRQAGLPIETGSRGTR